MNIEWSKKILTDLSGLGVEEIVFCAGARNSPLVMALDRAKGIRAYSFFEERSASFFALGLARKSGRPVAVITTSGTAAAELLPATIEAFHTGVPLILVTADRPRRLRGTGAPQAIDQTGLYSKFIAAEFDLESGADFDLSQWQKRAPVHLNICFDEPLIDSQLEDYTLTPAESETFVGASSCAATASAEWASVRLARFMKAPGDLMVLVGTLESDRERASVATFLRELGAPTYLEATSGLREDPSLAMIALRSGDKILPKALKEFGIKRVLRLGGIPTARVWRDLEDPANDVETFSLAPLPFAGLSRGEFLCCELSSTLMTFMQNSQNFRVPGTSLSLLTQDRALTERLEQLLREEPKSEPALVHALTTLMAEGSLAYVGNSLPIREWDLAATYEKNHTVEANRGVNGIDGQLSTFLGLCREEGENWALMGDLTAMYDLAGPWALTQKNCGQIRLVILNNGGGKIFNRIFNNALFENRHDFDFAPWAKQWRWDYEKWTEVPHNWSGGAQVMIELVPDNEATSRFWNRYDELFKSL